MAQKKVRKPARLSQASATHRPKQAKPAALPKRVVRGRKLMHFLKTNNVMFVVCIIIAAAILTIMYFRITRPDEGATPTVPPTTGTPSAHLLLFPTNELRNQSLTAPDFSV